MPRGGHNLPRPGGQGGVVCSADGGDLSVEAADRRSYVLTLDDDIGVVAGCDAVEGQHPVGERIEHLIRSDLQKGPSATTLEAVNAEADLGERHGCRVYASRSEPPHPRFDARAGHWPHELRDDVGVQNDRSGTGRRVHGHSEVRRSRSLRAFG